MSATDTENHLKPLVPALRFDWTDWLPYLEDQDVTDEQKRALIETLWSIVVGFVDLGWQINPHAEIYGSEIDLKSILDSMNTDNGEEAV